jgi:hypothetical protein
MELEKGITGNGEAFAGSTGRSWARAIPKASATAPSRSKPTAIPVSSSRPIFTRPRTSLSSCRRGICRRSLMRHRGPRTGPCRARTRCGEDWRAIVTGTAGHADGVLPRLTAAVVCWALHHNRGPLCRNDWLSVPFRALVSLSDATRILRAHDPTAPSALTDPGLVLVRGSDRPGFPRREEGLES